ncbi:bifunctional phosphopantothenoylcysteine decarboxylase/phosphopantothenate--cysteine ligase CoaBC [Porphyromonas pogonae]|uniref:bifunctional phosphopantothenoylcysteine decarboxylase/phosphopantothenate--cysteine ligase CoaBC n=1 Tax=Porphyromonas pogonae TaxID=867595 RepID=UPI002E79B35E|nr:bifunctional phosphopantothenoylcysteine decarboxylase/phosphopantothenate--cysteine ligase CoaBC [Porphyromonas pogonae]
MGNLKGKHIVLGITGSIAAYKAAVLTRLLIKEGAEVQIVITPAGKEFITPITLSALTSKPVISEFFSGRDGTWNSHVDLGLWADAMLIAPATAASIGKMAHGIADNMLITTYLSAKADVFIAPAMDLDMFAHPSTQENLEILKRRGNIIIEPGEGELASHLVGKGRMEEPEVIVERLKSHFAKKQSLQGKQILITAGPTYENIDPVRFIGNHSTGLMGICIANEFRDRGADVTLVLGPSSLSPKDENIKIIRVTSALEMLAACKKYISTTDIAVFSAAVADYRPSISFEEKMKREPKDEINISLIKNPDIAATFGKEKTDKQYFVGFSLETSSGEEEAQRKLRNKNLDMIVLNSLKHEGAGFGHSTNLITIFDKSGNKEVYELKAKEHVAQDIVDYIEKVIR